MMEKLLKRGSVFSLACLLAAGCSQNDSLPRPGGEGGQPVPLSVGQADLQTAVIATRAATTTLGAGSSIGVFIDNAAGVTSYAKRNNVRYNRGDAHWAAASEELYLTLDNAVVCAYYPYSAAVLASTSVNLEPALLSDGMEPLAYATNQTVNSEHKNVSFTLKQACAWLVLNLARGSGLAENVTITHVHLIGNGLSREYKINITNGSMVSQVAATDNRITLETGETLLAKGGNTAFNISLPPTTASITGGLTVGVTLKEQGKNMMVQLPAITSLAAGTKYTANLTVNGSGVTATSVEVAAWTPSTVNNSGNAFIPLP